VLLRNSTALLLAALVTLAATMAPWRSARAAPRELVIAHENLEEAGPELEKYLGDLLRRIEKVTGWPARSLKGKAFVNASEALPYIKKSRAGFAILPVHQLVQGYDQLKLDILGRAVGVGEGPVLEYVAVTRRPRSFESLEDKPGLRLAAVGASDPTWMQVATDGQVNPQLAVGLLETSTSKQALQSMLDGKVDVAVVSPTVWKPIEKRADARGDLDTLFVSAKLPAPAVVAVGKYVSAADRKKLAAALDLICQDPGGPACSRMGILYTQSGRQQNYEPLLQVYRALRPR
jgi:hypothetical protein